MHHSCNHKAYISLGNMVMYGLRLSPHLCLSMILVLDVISLYTDSWFDGVDLLSVDAVFCFFNPMYRQLMLSILAVHSVSCPGSEFHRLTAHSSCWTLCYSPLQTFLSVESQSGCNSRWLTDILKEPDKKLNEHQILTTLTSDQSHW